MSWFYVNNTGASIPVYHLRTHAVCGQINHRESFVVRGGAEVSGAIGTVIDFLNSDMNFVSGYITCIDSMSRWLDLPYHIIDGKRWFRARYDMNIYDPNANYVGKVEAGEFVITNSHATGSTHLDWLQIDAYRDKYTKELLTINGGHGFVDTGIATIGSGGSYIGIHGLW